MEYIRQQRMSLCCRLLLTTPSYRIVDICMMVGYDDLSAFNRTFKKYHALTPTQYRYQITRQNKEVPLLRIAAVGNGRGTGDITEGK